MLQQLINHSPDLKRLQDEGYKLEFKDDHLLIHRIPYMNSSSEIEEGVLVTVLDLSGNKTVKPRNHVIHFIGKHPCNKDGHEIKSIKHSSSNNKLTSSITVNHSFSNKPKNGGYKDYYHKITRYCDIISAHATSVDPSKTPRVYEVVEATEDNSVFNYYDTNSSRAEIGVISEKLKDHKIGIIGLGGTGSYILDHIAKTPVSEIHLIDGDQFLQHNAFRSPGAPSMDELRYQYFKTEYFKMKYSNMHRGIVSHPEFLKKTNLSLLDGLDFVFISIDKSSIKKVIFEHLIKMKISSIDVGLDIGKADSMLLATLRTTLITHGMNTHIKDRINLFDRDDDDYSSNIQISDLNALNANFAIIKWKKTIGFYQDLEREHSIYYSTNVNELYNEDN